MRDFPPPCRDIFIRITIIKVVFLAYISSKFHRIFVIFCLLGRYLLYRSKISDNRHAPLLSQFQKLVISKVFSAFFGFPSGLLGLCMWQQVGSLISGIVYGPPSSQFQHSWILKDFSGFHGYPSRLSGLLRWQQVGS